MVAIIEGTYQKKGFKDLTQLLSEGANIRHLTGSKQKELVYRSLGSLV